MKKGMLFLSILVRWAFSLIVGVLIIWGIMYLLTGMLVSSSEEIMAEDLSLSATALSASRGDDYFSYSPPFDNFDLVIVDGRLSLGTSSDVARVNIRGLNNLRVEETSIRSVSSIPIRYDSSLHRVFFEDLDLDAMLAYCNRLHGNIDSDSTFRATGSNSNILEDNFVARNINVQTLNPDFTIRLDINRNDDNLVVTYGDNMLDQKLACFIHYQFMQDLSNDFDNILFNRQDISNIRIIIGSDSSNPDFNKISRSIVDAVGGVLN